MSTKDENILMNGQAQFRLSPLWVLFFGIFAVSTSSVFIRVAQREASSLEVAAYRLSIASLVLLPFVWQKRAEFSRLRKRDWGLVVLSGAFLAAHFASWISSLAYTSVASSVVLVTTTPLWVALLSPVFLRERITRITWLGLLVALAGGVIVGASEACVWGSSGLSCPGLVNLAGGRSSLGNLLALVGAVMAAGYMIVGRRLRASLSLIGYIGSVYPVAALFLDGLALANGGHLGGFSALTWLCFVGLALIPQLLGHTSYNYALGYLPAAYVSVATLAEPVGTTLLAILILGELPTLFEIAGGVIILAGIAIASWKRM